MNHFFKLSLFIFSLHLFKPVLAQRYNVDSIASQSTKLPLNISYFGDFLVKPGCKIGTEFPVRTVQKTKFNAKGKTRVVENKFFCTANIGYSHTRGFNNSIFLNSEFGYRRTRKSGFKTEILLGAGLMRTFLYSATYQVDELGRVDIEKSAGTYYFMPMLSYGLGYNFENKHPELPVSIVFKPCFFFQTPYNHYALPHIAFELGVSYQFLNCSKSFKSRKKYKSKKLD